jgi:Txe/YoeB family toxin of Txe-Axe toxin-antitoxin module
MKLQFLERGWEQFEYWRVNDARMLSKISELLKDCRRIPIRVSASRNR